MKVGHSEPESEVAQMQREATLPMELLRTAPDPSAAASEPAASLQL